MSEYSLYYSELKEKAEIEKYGLSEGTIHRIIQFCNIPRKEISRGYLYSKESIEKLKLCMKLKGYGKTISEMNLLFDNYSLGYLMKKLANIQPEQLSDMINNAKKKEK